MKRAILYKTSLVFFLFPLMIFSNNGEKGKYIKEKTIKKEFNVSKNTTLKIDNSYGNLDIVTWNEDRIEFQILIQTSGKDEEKVQEKLDDISVSFDSSSDYVSAVTKFSKNKPSSWWKWNSSNNVNMKINYLVKIPITNNIDLDNDYGAINIAKLEGKAILNCDYGKITTKELLADNNDISFDYSNNCYFEYIKSGKINADYSDFTVSKTNAISINADYTKSKIEIAENINYNCDYGAVTVEKVNNLKGNGDYLTVKIGEVYKNISINADYGSIKIEHLTKSTESVSIEADYVGVKLGYDSDFDFNFQIELEYGSLKHDDGLEFLTKRIESSDKYYAGYHGSENSGKNIRINSEYGGVTFNRY